MRHILPGGGGLINVMKLLAVANKIICRVVGGYNKTDKTSVCQLTLHNLKLEANLIRTAKLDINAVLLIMLF